MSLLHVVLCFMSFKCKSALALTGRIILSLLGMLCFFFRCLDVIRGSLIVILMIFSKLIRR